MADNAPMSFEDQLADFARLVEAARRLQGADTVPPAIAVDERGQPVVQVGPERVRQAVPDATGVVAGQYGLPPMPERAPPEMRSANTPLGDLVAQGTNSPLLGAFASGAENAGRTVGKIGLEFTGVPQAVRAGNAVADAAIDPTIPNMGNAAIQTGMAVFNPRIIGAGLVGGYGAAAAKDMGLLGTEAQAQRAKAPAKTAEPPIMRPGLDEQQNAELSKLEELNRTQGYIQPADMARLRALRAISDKFTEEEAGSKRRAREAQEAADRQAAADKKAADLKAYTGATERADANLEAAKQGAKERAAGRSFSNTAVGQLYDKAGIVSPLIAAMGFGAAARVPGEKYAEKAVLPLTVAGGVATNYPYMHNYVAAAQEPLNPEKVAYSDYARDLPPEHPRREEWKTYANGLPDENPLLTQNRKAFFDPVGGPIRTAVGAFEGWSGGHLGRILAEAGMLGPQKAYQNAKGELGEAINAIRATSKTTSPPGAGQASSLPPALPQGPQAIPQQAQPQLPPPLPPGPGAAAPTPGTPPSPLSGGGLMTMSPRPAQPPMQTPAGPNPSPLASGGANQSTTSDILSSIKRAERDMPNPAIPGAPAQTEAKLPPHIKQNVNGTYYDERTGHPIPKKFYKSLGLEE